MLLKKIIIIMIKLLIIETYLNIYLNCINLIFELQNSDYFIWSFLIS